MIFLMNVEFYCEIDDKLKEAQGFIFAENFKEAMSNISDYYGEAQLDKVSLEAFGPTQILEFSDDKEIKIFDMARAVLAEKQVW